MAIKEKQVGRTDERMQMEGERTDHCLGVNVMSQQLLEFVFGL